VANDPRLCAFEVTVIVFGGGTARLDGKVSSEAERRRVETLAREAGARQIEDRLQVDPSAAEPARC
jgi:osmotically-inducible protein OsmY